MKFKIADINELRNQKRKKQNLNKSFWSKTLLVPIQEFLLQLSKEFRRPFSKIFIMAYINRDEPPSDLVIRYDAV